MDGSIILVDICRTCGAEDGEVGIFSEKGLEMQLAERINAYLPISVSATDDLPLALCQVCIDRLDSCHQLVASCVDTDERLKQLSSTNLEQDDFSTSQIFENDENYAYNDMLIYHENASGNSEMESVAAGKVIAHKLDIKATGLVAPNVYVIPSLNKNIVNNNNETPCQNSLKKLSNYSIDGFYCDGCNVWFKRQDKFITHQLHCPLIKTYVCVLCDYAACDKVDLVKHTGKHTSFQDKMFNRSLQNVCNVCNRVLSTKMSLKLHMRTHSGEKPYNCQFCEKAFAQKNALNYHEKTHTCEKPYHCRYCKKGFNGKLVLQTHERTHTGERPYTCIICGARFRCLANLRQHQLIHTNDKPFKCPLCNKAFRRPEKVRIHLRTHTGEKPYACPICHRRFSQRGDMMKHKLIHDRFDRDEPDVQKLQLAEFNFVI